MYAQIVIAIFKEVCTYIVHATIMMLLHVLSTKEQANTAAVLPAVSTQCVCPYMSLYGSPACAEESGVFLSFRYS